MYENVLCSTVLCTTRSEINYNSFTEHVSVFEAVFLCRILFPPFFFKIINFDEPNDQMRGEQGNCVQSWTKLLRRVWVNFKFDCDNCYRRQPFPPLPSSQRCLGYEKKPGKSAQTLQDYIERGEREESIFEILSVFLLSELWKNAPILVSVSTSFVQDCDIIWHSDSIWLSLY